MGNAEKQVFAFIFECDIANFYHSGLLDELEELSKQSVEVKLLTSYSPKSCFFIEKMKLKKTKYSVSEVEELPTFLIMDDTQILLIIRKNNGKKKVAALWTNYDAFIKALKTLFTQLWNNRA